MDTLKKQFYITISGFIHTPAFQYVLSTMGADSILYASDYPLESSIATTECFDTLPLSIDEKNKIVYENAKLLLGARLS